MEMLLSQFFSQDFNQIWREFQGTADLWMFLLAVATVCSLLLYKLCSLPIFRLMTHWLRWLTFAFFVSWILKSGFGSTRPDWLHFVTGLAIWFIVETLVYRISIQVLNLSEMNLFPNYSEDHADNLWPIHSRAMRIRKTLLEKGFRSIGTVKAQVHDHLIVRQALYINTDKSIRLSVLFIPDPKNRIHLYFSLYSVSKSGTQYITDNQNMPFGGYYPDHWAVQRYPLCHSLKSLLKEHLSRRKRTDQSWVCLDDESAVVHNLNQCQRELELKNRQMGFLLYLKSEDGKQISPKGCFRIWTEMWLLAYFGRTVSRD